MLQVLTTTTFFLHIQIAYNNISIKKTVGKKTILFLLKKDYSERSFVVWLVGYWSPMVAACIYLNICATRHSPSTWTRRPPVFSWNLLRRWAMRESSSVRGKEEGSVDASTSSSPLSSPTLFPSISVWTLRYILPYLTSSLFVVTLSFNEIANFLASFTVSVQKFVVLLVRRWFHTQPLFFFFFFIYM